jgi:hypothetical protein
MLALGDIDATDLTMLFLESQDLKGFTPTQLVEKYIQVKKEITNAISHLGAY